MFNNDWDSVLKEELNKEYFIKIRNYISEERKTKVIYPPKEDLFKAFFLCTFSNLKVVIIGQDPYHGENEAMGLSFSVRKGIKIPPSLKNIFKELESDLGIKRNNTDLTDWAKQGILLLNSSLTVEKDKPNSHKDIGWEIFTNNVISIISKNKENVVFVLWGNSAKGKRELIDNKKHYVIMSAHPSPLSASRGFFQSKPFSKINNFLELKNMEKINF